MKKFLILLIIVTVISIIIVGTSCKETTTTTMKETTITTIKEAGEKPTLTFWITYSTPEAYMNLFKSFEKDTGYKLDMMVIPDPKEETVLTKWAAGERPDILDFHSMGIWLPQLNPEKNFIDLSNLDFVNKTKYDLLKGVLTTNDGKVWGPILSFPHICGVIYNKEIFKKLSINIPTNFEEYLKVCKVIKDAGITPLYAAAKTAWPIQVDAFNLFSDGVKANPNWFDDLNTGKKDFNQPTIIQGLEAVQKVVNAGYYQDNFLVGTYEDSIKAIFDGDVAMINQGEWALDVLAQDYDLAEVNKRIGMFGLSMNSDIINWSSSSPGATYVVPKTGNSEKEKGAVEFIKYITGPAYQQLCNELQMKPVIEGFETPEIKVEAKNDMYKAFEKNTLYTFDMFLLVPYGPFDVFMQEMFAGTKTPLDVAKALSEEFAKNAKVAKLPGW